MRSLPIIVDVEAAVEVVRRRLREPFVSGSFYRGLANGTLSASLTTRMQPWYGFDPEKPLSPQDPNALLLQDPLTNRELERFTVIISAGDGSGPLLRRLVRRFNPIASRVAQLIIVCASGAPNQLGSELPIRVVTEDDYPSLITRFALGAFVKTRAVLLMDDDIEFNVGAVIEAFRIWQRARDRIVGFDQQQWDRGRLLFRRRRADESTWYSMTSTRIAFINKRYLGLYMAKMYAAARIFVTQRKNCEDILMNFVVANSLRLRLRDRNQTLPDSRGVGHAVFMQLREGEGMAVGRVRPTAGEVRDEATRADCTAYFENLFGTDILGRSEASAYFSAALGRTCFRHVDDAR